MQIPKEHKFKVSGIAAQTLGVFSHTSVDQVLLEFTAAFLNLNF